ncbi:MAG: class I SAM-dependent methyltransferase [Deltaproteobacteria bacterium]|nr:class I SAM-dependent methyltransferase [Deltaproteobacteria bacterium]
MTDAAPPPRLCPVCRAARWTPLFAAPELFDGSLFPVARCPSCGLVATLDDLEPQELAAYYRYAEEPDAGHRFRAPLEPFMRLLRKERIKAVLRLRAAPGRILDVGSGRAVMLEALASRGWECWGTELEQEIAVSARRRLGDRVVVGQFEDLELPVRDFDVITFWHVFEHLADPSAAFAKTRELLAPDGVVLVSVPNVDSCQARLSGRDWLHLDVPRHRWHFTPDTLARLATAAGLEVLHAEQFSLEYGPYGMLQSGLAKLGLGQRLFTRVLRPAGGHAIWREPAFWTHLALALPIAAAAALSLPLEAIAAAAGKGGVIALALRRADRPRNRAP